MRRGLNVILIALTLSGCKSNDSSFLVGTWQSSLGGAMTTYHFRKDGTFTLENLYAGTHAVVQGRYAMENGKLCTTPVSYELQGQGPEADQIRSVIMQPSRVSLFRERADAFQLGTQMPSLHVHRLSPVP